MNLDGFIGEFIEAYDPEDHEEIILKPYESIQMYIERCKYRINPIIKNIFEKYKECIGKQIFDFLIFIKDEKIVLRGKKQKGQKNLDEIQYWYNIFHKTEKKVIEMIRKDKQVIVMRNFKNCVLYIYYHKICNFEKSNVNIFLQTNNIQWHKYWEEYLLHHYKQNNSFYLGFTQLDFFYNIFKIKGLKSLQKINRESIICNNSLVILQTLNILCNNDTFEEVPIDLGYNRMKKNILSFFSKKKDKIENQKKRLITYENIEKMVNITIARSSEYKLFIKESQNLLTYMNQRISDKDIFFFGDITMKSHFIPFFRNIFMIPTQYFDLQDIFDSSRIWTPDVLLKYLCCNVYSKEWKKDPCEVLLSVQKYARNRYKKDTTFFSQVDIRKVSHKGLLIINTRNYLSTRYSILRCFFTRLTHIYENEDMTIIIISNTKCRKDQLLLSSNSNFSVNAFSMQSEEEIHKKNEILQCNKLEDNNYHKLYQLLVKITTVVINENQNTSNNLHQIVEYVYNYSNKNLKYSLEPCECSKDAYELNDVLVYICYYQQQNKLIILPNENKQRLEIVNLSKKYQYPKIKKGRFDMEFYYYVSFLMKVIVQYGDEFENYVKEKECNDFITSQLQKHGFEKRKKKRKFDST